MAVMALDLGGTKLASGIFDNSGKILYKNSAALEQRNGEDVGNLIVDQIWIALQYAQSENRTIEAIGMCVPGISYSKKGTVWAPNIPGWDNYPLRDKVLSTLGDIKIPVLIDSDRACSILGETWLGAAKGCSDAIFIAVGTGIGAGVMIDGRILRGSNDIAGAVGWLALDRLFNKKYISCGCFEQQASGEGLAKTARELLEADNNYSGILRRKKIDDINAHDIFSAFSSHDVIAQKVIGQAIELWGMAAANLVSIFNPEKIIFGGGVFGPALQFLPEIKEEAFKWGQPISITQVRFEGSTLGSDAVLYGAGCLALRALEK
jgi:glucokinase